MTPPPGLCDSYTATDVKRDTEAFWRGKFGADYAARSPGDQMAVGAMMHKITNRRPIHSAIEFGAGACTNLRAIFMLNPSIEMTAVEINAETLAQAAVPYVEKIVGSMLDFDPFGRQWDLSFTRGVLIHIPPEHLPAAYKALHASSRRYVMIAEYYNPTPVEIPYRGHAGRLWKRDFAGEIMAQHKDLHLIDYGFVYRGDPLHPQDDITWFLMEKEAQP